NLPLDVTAMSSAPPGLKGPAVTALDRDGAAEVGLEGAPGEASPVFRTLVVAPTVLRDVHAFLPELWIAGDLDGDDNLDLMLPALSGVEVFRGTGEGFSMKPSARLSLPGDDDALAGGRVRRRYPLPRVEDVDGDGLPDLVVGGPGSEHTREVWVLAGAGEGRFLPARRIGVGCLKTRLAKGGDPEMIQFGDLDGKPGAELAVQREIDTDQGDIKEAKQPHSIVSFHKVKAGFEVDPDPYFEIEVVGYPFNGQLAGGSPVPFRDLDGDGRKDLITVTLDFSLFQVLRVLTTKKLGIGLDFHVWRQEKDGTFAEVQGLKLSDKILLDLNDLKWNRLGNFAGDFDGDGLQDFLTLKGGRTVEITRGAPGCAYATSPDYKLKLVEEPQDAGFVRVMDLDGDGRDDLAVTRLLEVDPSGASTPVVLDLYVSGKGR
ncbi:MAG TPA: VCBS repeat-containing protein, partial [Candidatus Saccharimonadales bacterium]|nr:VCBS repeat-containing protein [Candidatus Saccharimonadales bacterium]